MTAILTPYHVPYRLLAAMVANELLVHYLSPLCYACALCAARPAPASY